jgi:hypothetical protein
VAPEWRMLAHPAASHQETEPAEIPDAPFPHHPPSVAGRAGDRWPGRGPAHAQTADAWPRKTVKILVGFPGGSTPDIAARVLADVLAKAWGQAVIVENRPGASGNLAANTVAKANDDHTLGVVINGNLTSAKLLNPKLPFNPAKDFSLPLAAGHRAPGAGGAGQPAGGQ